MLAARLHHISESLTLIYACTYAILSRNVPFELQWYSCIRSTSQMKKDEKKSGKLGGKDSLECPETV